jgi:Xaa-Pro aminopeptidase
MKDKNIYQNRRNALTNKFSRTLFVIPAGHGAQRSHSVQYRFKVASDFYYLTGLQISDGVLIVAGSQSYLLQNQNVDHVWGEFSGLGAEDAELVQGLQLESIANLEKVLHDLTNEYDRIAFSFGRDQLIENTVLQTIQFQRRLGRTRNFALDVCDSRTLVGSLRAIKEQDEIANLKLAGQKSSLVHQKLMQQKLIGRSEKEISNWIEAQFLLENMQWTSYETIVGAGSRSTVLHARATNQIVKENQLVLVDAGAEWKGYCADITRTLPSGDKFSSEQRYVYEIVLAAQKAALNAIRPGETLQSIHETVLEVFKEKLQTVIPLKRFMPHSTSHWIGLDVHDPCAYLDDQGKPIKLQNGMCFTVEPGLYFNQIEGFEKFNGIGVRIEDDVVVTENGFEFLTAVQKEIDEIEQLRAISHTR